MIIVYRIIVINTTITKKVKTINDHNNKIAYYICAILTEVNCGFIYYYKIIHDNRENGIFHI